MLMRRKSAALFCLVALALQLVLISCGGGGGGHNGGSGTVAGTIEGVVRNFVSGLGIAGATINVYDGATLIATTTTDANGDYSVDVDAGNDYTVEIISAGFISAT
jgi:hypothetical protein